MDKILIICTNLVLLTYLQLCMNLKYKEELVWRSWAERERKIKISLKKKPKLNTEQSEFIHIREMKEEQG